METEQILIMYSYSWYMSYSKNPS